MKISRFVFMFGLFFFGLLGCNKSTTTVPDTVPDPPAFVEMYLDPEADVNIIDVKQANSGKWVTLSEVTTEPVLTTEPATTVQTTTVDPWTVQYDGEVYSETDFEVVLITNGIHYDLLYSVELVDSIFGTCIYTDQSVLYRASSTIIVENDGTYTTQVVLTIPGSTEHDSYLSGRTITLSKILFTRDTANGTFPADIPQNTTTELLFAVHARNYFDLDLGLPLSVNDAGMVDIILTPESDHYEEAMAEAIGTISIPQTMNGYEIGAIVLIDTAWISQLTIAEAEEEVLILGDFSSLTSVTFSGIIGEMVEGVYRDIMMVGNFPLLTDISIFETQGYGVYLGLNLNSQEEVYLQYMQEADAPYYDFPLLESIDIENSRLIEFQVGSDNLALSFPSLSSVVASHTVFGSIDFGLLNMIPKLSTFTLTECQVGEATIGGNKPILESPATFSATGITVNYETILEGSLFSTLLFDDSELGVLHIFSGEEYVSPLETITFSNSSLIYNGGGLFLEGSYPYLEDLNISDIEVTSINIGGIDSEFANLQNIILTNINGQRITIGARDADFGMLEAILIQNVSLSGNLLIGCENGLYSHLSTLEIDNLQANDLAIGQGGGDFSTLQFIHIYQADLVGTLSVAGGNYNLLSDIIMVSSSANYLIISPNLATYDLYFDQFIAESNIYIFMPGCEHIFVSETDVTTWPYYDYAMGESIPVSTGTYTPS